MLQWQRKKAKDGQKPLYSFEEVNKQTLRVTREYEGDIFQHEFSVGDDFTTYDGLHVKMDSLNPSGGSTDSGYYIIVREVTEDGLGSVDLCCANVAQQYIGSHININASDTILA